MSGNSHDLHEILQALGSLKARVDTLVTEPSAEADAPPAVGEACDRRQGDALVLLRAQTNELIGLTKASAFPEFFARLATRTGLRMLLLKRWSSGLQVYLERNIELPPEARTRRSDGRAPIPTGPDDVFAACGQEAQVYAGPVPLKNFPLDLTLMLGRGSRDRRIVIIPLPAKEHWNSFLYFDGDPGAEAALTVVELLGHHAVDRLRLLQRGDSRREGRVTAIMKHELCRRDTQPGAPAGRDGAARPVESPAPVAPAAPSDGAPPPGDEDLAVVLPASARRAWEARAMADTIVNAWEEAVLGCGGDAPRALDAADLAGAANEPMAPEDILRRAGELPALPKAAVHILAVIDDPRTTATRLEKAVATDQALTAKILRIANSPFYGAVREIKTVSEAIVRLGFVTIRNWTLVTATKSVFLAPGAGTLYQKIWRQSVLSAMAAQLVAHELRSADPETAFLGGLMQNIGQLVLARSKPELFQQVLIVSADEGLPYSLVEQELLGFDHGDLGALLIKEWNLSEDLEQAVRWHHRFEHPNAQNRPLATIIALGEDVAACTGAHPDEVDQRWEKSRAAEVLGLTSDAFARLQAQARDLSVDPQIFA